jgi:hypothetical protein
LSALRHRESGNHADERLPVFLRMHGLRHDAAAEARLLLRVLLLRVGALPPNSGGAFGRYRGTLMLHGKSDMTKVTIRRERDWLSSPLTSSFAWWVPEAAIIAGLLIQVPARTAIWVSALAWMGTACILNARRCGRTHCRFTGPFYLAMIFPVLVLGLTSFGLLPWLALCAVIIVGGKVIWWRTERAWGQFY